MQTIQGFEDKFTKWVVDLEEQHEGNELTFIASGSGVATWRSSITQKHVHYVLESSNIS